ncbi:hypothetical protein EJ02DRAFT_370931 [Clathrospora elynae]|uniref:C3H1-type domain-containing protein n=1 Tax=Clathrospora elynae TaxID=706981 RepID=A0A6A5SY02_9PLEO|nr:hypothetical protein EJ02DRAFT_370931 [Clathrospora elynae]
MLADGKIDSLDTHLEQFKLNDHNRQNDLQNLLREYGQLLDDYKVLKKAYEEKGTKSVAKAVATPTVPVANTAKPRHAYVLVLVDGNDYVFNDELIREKEEGGMRAARMLNDAVEKYLHQSVPEARTARVIVRIYADLTNLSKQLAKSKVLGMEKRSIAPFSAAFTRAISFFDFVDALDEEGTKFKIREQFKIASEDSACSHILYAACHDPAYLSQLVPFSGIREKVTLVQGAGWKSDFHQFNLNVTQFPTIFRWSGLPVAAPITKASTPTAPKQKVAPRPVLTPALPTPRKESWRRNGSMSVTDSAFGTDDLSPVETNGFGDQKDRVGWENRSAYTQTQKGSATVAQKDTPVCKYFPKGNCRFDNKCKFLHIRKGVDGSNCKNGPSQPPPGPPQALPGSSQASLASHPTPVTTSDRASISSTLPTATVPRFIPLNNSAQRLDTYIRPPTQEEWRIYNTRFQIQRPCNSFHMQRICTTFDCSYDHNELEPEALHVLEYVLKCNPCPSRSACRAGDCFYGHICQKDGCTGQMKGCRMKADLHAVEAKMVSMVPADDDEVVHGEGVSLGALGGPDDGDFLW